MQSLGTYFLSNASLGTETPTKLFKSFYRARSTQFAPLCAIFGGIVAQEALKSITNKFTPIKQRLHIDFHELTETDTDAITLKNDRYDSLRLCFNGETTLTSLKSSKIFMVGCGAIGCEIRRW